MEQLNSGCIILKNKEYEELVAKANSKKQDEILISWRCTIGFNTKNTYKIESVSGDFTVSNGLSNQIRKILARIEDKSLEQLRQLEFSIEKSQRYKFSKLSWWNRLFFKP